MRKKSKKIADLEGRFRDLWTQLYPEIPFLKQQKLIPGRRYQHDFVFSESKVAIEIQGQIWHKGGHSSGIGLLRDYEKLMLATREGYTCLFLADRMITEEYLVIIKEIIDGRT